MREYWGFYIGAELGFLIPGCNASNSILREQERKLYY